MEKEEKPCDIMRAGYEKLLKVQSEVKAPKGQRNDFGGYSYRSCEDILEAVKPILSTVNATIVLTDEIKLVEDRFYVQATARFIDCNTGWEISNSAFAREECVKKGMDGSQITGASSSYARKYALNGLLLIDDNKDSDATNSGEIYATKNQVDKMVELEVNQVNVFKKFGVQSLNELTYEQAEFVIKSKEKSLKEMAEKANG